MTITLQTKHPPVLTDSGPAVPAPAGPASALRPWTSMPDTAGTTGRMQP
jgi:hypothetical protein